MRCQYELAAHIRDPRRNPPPPGVEERRMRVYRELFYNNVEGFLRTGFPVLRRITPEDRWHALARDFFARHRCETPLFTEIGQEFLAYLEHERGMPEEDPPFLLELAHYEWVELALEMAEEPPGLGAIDPKGDLLAGVPVLSPLAWVVSYRFPVHRIGPDFQPTDAPEQPTHLLVHRDREERIGFIELSPLTHRLLVRVRDNPGHTGRELLEGIAAELGHLDPRVVVGGGRQTLEDLRGRGAVLGARPRPSATQR
jgi:hypothetical protein